MANNSLPRRPEDDLDSRGEAGSNAGEPHKSNNEDMMEDVLHTAEETDALFFDDKDSSQQVIDYDTFQPGFSDDEGGADAFDRSWTAQQLRKKSPKSNKLPRRSENADSDDETSQQTKRPRKSLFGGPAQDVPSPQREEFAGDHIGDEETLNASKPDIRHRLGSLDLNQQNSQNDEDVQLGRDEHTPDLGTSAVASKLPAPSRAPSEESIDIPPDTEPVYELRQNINRTKVFTYIDTDKTGNYDPAQEAKLNASRLQKAKLAKKKGKSMAKEKEKKEHIVKCIVKLYFDAFGNVRNLTNDEDNWPEGWSDVDSEDEAKAAEYRHFYRRRTPGIDIQTAIEDSRGLVEDLTGYPAARGCKRCRELDQECSMTEGGTFPCKQCDEDEEDCTPILKPHVKGSCQRCVDDERETCSFEDFPHQNICDMCAEYEYICNALPPEGYKTPRISIDAIMYGPDRKHVQCTVCRSEKKRCSLKKKTDKPPCKHCKKNGIGCVFYDLPQTNVGRKKKTVGPKDGGIPKASKPGSEFFSPEDLADIDVEDEEEVMSREATPEIEMEDNAGNKGMLTKIKTSIAYPLEINVASERPEDCNYCGFPVFGFIGHFEREVHVIRWNNGLGYTEVGGGHCEEKGPTKMCIDCTNSRLQTIICPRHEYQHLFDDEETPDFGIIANDLLNSEPGSAGLHYQLRRWCSICFSVATWGCATPQPSLTGEEDEVIIGCGLRFCDKCIETLGDVYLWDLEALANFMAKMPKTSEDDEQTGELEGKPRADVGFLQQNGLLMRIMNASE